MYWSSDKNPIGHGQPQKHLQMISVLSYRQNEKSAVLTKRKVSACCVIEYSKNSNSLPKNLRTIPTTRFSFIEDTGLRMLPLKN